MKTNINDIYNAYLAKFPAEKDGLRRLEGQLQGATSDIISRKNFTGHVTASAFIVHCKTGRVLLLHHAALDTYLQPGGHVEPEDESLLAAVYREIEEETGLLQSQLALRSLCTEAPEVPFDIDTHHIPANPKKSEPEHYHHDMRYLFMTDADDIATDAAESHGFAWVEWDNFACMLRFVHVAEKIQHLR